VGVVVHAVESEMAITLQDVIYRRTGLGTIGYPGRNCVERCAGIMSKLCGWDDDKKVREMESLNRNLLSEGSV
jgi:glycerol-3-phosphate dehydrogenase